MRKTHRFLEMLRWVISLGECFIWDAFSQHDFSLLEVLTLNR